MVKLAENAGFGFDKIESNWFEYNKTAPVYKLEFDSVTTSFYFAANDNNETSEQVTGEVVIEIQRIVVAINGEMKRSEIQSLLNLKHDDYFRTQYIIPALEKDYITMKFPDSSNHPQRRYILTRRGILLKKELI
ncbi:Fic family protein [Flavobacterium sp. GB2R13]|uniref:Fic family protein n=1 Tax=Flavobacterium algoris TaxID=3398733 RepID=UPI003A8C6958